MCGIIGLISKLDNGFSSVEETIFKELLIADQLRGEDSTGVFGVGNANKPDIIKGAMHSSDFVNTKAYSSFATALYNRYKLVIGHNRKATKGNVVSANAHPFSEGKITLVHNGTIRNQAKLNAEVEVDSHAICHALNDNDAVKALGLIDGAFALAWYDSEAKTLNLARNDERPLNLIEFENFWCISSEAALVFWIAGRNGLKAKEYKVLPTEKIITFSLDNRKEYVEVPFKEWTYVPPVTTIVPPKWSTITDPPKTKIAGLLEQRKAENSPAPGKHASAVIGTQLLIKWVDFAEGADKAMPGVRLIGHPVYRDEALTVDENIIVSFWKPSLNELEFDEYFGVGYFTGYVHSFGTSNGPTFYVRDVNPCPLSVSANMHPITDIEFATAVKDGCKYCNTKIFSFNDVPRMFIKPRKNGSYRLICASCFQPKGDNTVQ